MRKIHCLYLIFLAFAAAAGLCAQTVTTSAQNSGSTTHLKLANDMLECSVLIDSSRLVSDRITGLPDWTKGEGTRSSVSLETDGDFRMEVMWTEWQAPNKLNNAENPVVFTKADFLVVSHSFEESPGGARELRILLKGREMPLHSLLVYRLEPGSFYIRRQLTVIDSGGSGHFLQLLASREGSLRGKYTILKEGGFGQPAVLRSGDGGGFFGLEYPAADNLLKVTPKGLTLICSQEIGQKITKEGVAGEWVVEGLTPNVSVKHWFMKYVDRIRVAPLKPYTLYNSWYDLRSPEYPKVPPGNVMNEANIMRIIDLIRKNMIEKHRITLDAFVLDDGWDVYKSDWVLRTEQFPRGLKPISDELKKTGTSLGLWFGPIGGYSFRSQRVGWMKEHGYEITGDQMCVAGKNYSQLLTKRVTDFTEKEGVGYFKWDGIQFSCSEPDHGHPVGIYSRRAVMESVIRMCTAVREKNPAMFLNITSGTWLSPWWVKYANQIWMQGADYGYADVPSLSPRDAAITYKDMVLHEDFTLNNFWFPIANLMTHGIIKGNLEMLGGEAEPLDKFTNEALFYLARGVSMWELYISPDILTEGEWNAMSQSLLWAKDRF
jgi:hypothetical protein